ncbi:MAG: flippase-like domain-containing protein, partial [Proteobacteria bacterium]|nr:flippase-like domain-containing protein [Pseudomonadota bacterium]
ISPLVRSWLVARLEALKMSTVLATAAIDRLVDGMVFVAFIPVPLLLAAYPDPGGGIRLGLLAAGGGSVALFAGLAFALARYKRQAARPEGWLRRLIERLPARFAGSAEGAALSFAEGIVWPRKARRGLGIVLASVVIKLIALTHFLWAGLAFGVVLRPADYVFLLVFLGFLIILTRFARIPGGFFIGAIFALDLLGVAEEPALAMVLVVQFSSMLTIACLGALALWRNGMTLGKLRLAEADVREEAVEGP